jgi:hypothetical protein
MQLYGFSPVWTLICWLSWLLCANDLPHKVQLHGFSPAWTLRCMSSWLFLPEVFIALYTAEQLKSFWQQAYCVRLCCQYLHYWYLFLTTRTTSAWIILMWTARQPFCANDLPHNVQLYGFSQVWTLICWLRRQLSVNNLPHNVHLYGLSSVRTLTCWLSWCPCANDLPHKVQLYGFSPVWTRICLSRLLLVTNILLHCWQLNNLVCLTVGIFWSTVLSAIALSPSHSFQKILIF